MSTIIVGINSSVLNDLDLRQLPIYARLSLCNNNTDLFIQYGFTGERGLEWSEFGGEWVHVPEHEELAGLYDLEAGWNLADVRDLVLNAQSQNLVLPHEDRTQVDFIIGEGSGAN